jgi:cation transporter-like permease
MIPLSPPPVDIQEPTQIRPGDTTMPQLDTTSAAGIAGNANDDLGRYIADETIVNRTMRPGLFNYQQNLRGEMQNMSDTPSARLKKASSFPDHVISGGGHSGHIEGFDFDKDALNYPQSPSKSGDGDMLLQMWSSGLSPTNQSKRQSEGANDSPLLPNLPNYGTHPADEDGETQRFGPGRKTNVSGSTSWKARDGNDERRPLLDAIPGEVTTNHRNSIFTSLTSIRTYDDLNSLAESVFSDVRSEGTSTVQSISNEAKEYLECSMWQRAFPERLFALTVTLLFEIPVLLMVSGGSDRLCYLIGRTKYQLLLGFLPLSSAISGNVGLQASTLTTRAISHGQVKVENYKAWLFKEIGAATYLGIGMGLFLGIIAFCASGYSLAFGLTVMTAQFISILTAGCTGTFAPLLFTFIFERDSGKWGGPLETAVQDIVGSFAMVIISYQILLWMGPFEIAENDTCGVADLQ